MSVFNNGLYNLVVNVASEQTQYDDLETQFVAFETAYNTAETEWNLIGVTDTPTPTTSTQDSGVSQIWIPKTVFGKGVYLVYMSCILTATGDHPWELNLWAQLYHDDGTAEDYTTELQAEYGSSSYYGQGNNGNNNTTQIAHQAIYVLNGNNALYAADENTNIRVGCYGINTLGEGTYTISNAITRISQLF